LNIDSSQALLEFRSALPVRRHDQSISNSRGAASVIAL
jgi:hypothetical protein